MRLCPDGSERMQDLIPVRRVDKQPSRGADDDGCFGCSFFQVVQPGRIAKADRVGGGIDVAVELLGIHSRAYGRIAREEAARRRVVAAGA